MFLQDSKVWVWLPSPVQRWELFLGLLLLVELCFQVNKVIDLQQWFAWREWALFGSWKKSPVAPQWRWLFEHPESRVCVRVAYKYPSRNFLVVQLWTTALWVQFPAQPSSYCGARLEVPKFPFCVDFRCCPGVSLEEETADKKLSKVQWLHFHIKPLWYLGIVCWCFQASVLQIGMCLVALHNWIVKFIFKL